MADYDDDTRSPRSGRTSASKMIPKSSAVEEAVLAFCLRENPTEWWSHVASVSGLEDATGLFFQPGHSAVAETMEKISQAGNTISQSLIIDKLNSLGYSSLGDDSEEPEDFLLSISLNSDISTAPALDKAVAHLKELAQRRDAISSVESIVANLHDQDIPMAQISSALSELSTSALSASTRSLPSFGDIFDRVMYSDRATYTVPTGMPSLDYALGGGSSIDGEKDEEISGGLGSGRTYVIAAGSGVGKTTTMFRFAREAIDHDVMPIIYSLESSEADMLAKFISGDSNGKFKQIMRSLERKDPEFKDVDEEDRATVLESAERYRDRVKIVSQEDMINGIYDIPASVMSVRTELDDPNAKIVLYIDYLQLLTTDSKYERQELSDMTRELHNMAQSLDIPIVMLSQFSKMEKGVRPEKRDLYGTSAIENNADGIMLMWRPGQLENPEDADDDFANAGFDENVMLIDLAKNRVGENVIVKAIVEHSRSIVEEMSDEDIERYSSATDDDEDDSDTSSRPQRGSDSGGSRRAPKSRRARGSAGGSEDLDVPADTKPSLSRRAKNNTDGSSRRSRRKRRASVDADLEGIGV